MQPSNQRRRARRRKLVADAAYATVRACIDNSLELPAGDYQLDRPVMLGAGDELLMHPDVVLRPSGLFRGPLVSFNGSNTALRGGRLTGATVLDGWVDEGGIWSAPCPVNNIDRCFSLIRNGEVKEIATWPILRKEELGCLRVHGSDCRVRSPMGALDSTLATGLSWTVAVWISMFYSGMFLQIAGETSAAPNGVMLYHVQRWDGTKNVWNLGVYYSDGLVVKQHIVYDFQFSSYQLVMVSYDAAAKVLKLSVNDTVVAEIQMVEGLRIQSGRAITIGGNAWNTLVDNVVRGFVSTLAVWSRDLTQEERELFYNRRRRYLWDELPQQLRDGCAAFWGFARSDDLGYADVGPRLTGLPDFMWCPHGLGDRTIGILPHGYYPTNTPSAWPYIGTSYPDNISWRPDIGLPSAEPESDVWMISPVFSWQGVHNLGVRLDPVKNCVVGAPQSTRWGGPRSVFLWNVKGAMIPGTWCQKPQTGRVYYMPEPGETLENSVFELPVATTLVQRTGARPGPYKSYDVDVAPSPLLENITIEDVTFENTSFSSLGRSNSSMATASQPRSSYPESSAVDLHGYVNNVRVERCEFYNLMNYKALSCDCHSDGFVIRGCTFHRLAAAAIAFGEQPSPLVGGENKNVLIEYCDISKNGLVSVGSMFAVHFSVCDGFTFQHNKLHDIAYSAIGASPARSCIGGGLVLHTFRNVTIRKNHFDNFLKMAADGAAVYIANGANPTVTPENNAIEGNLITRMGSVRFDWFGYNELSIYFDAWAKWGWTISDNVVLLALGGGILYGPHWGPNDIQASGRDTDIYVRNNVTPYDQFFQFQFYDFDPDTLLETVPRTQMTILVGDDERRLRLLYGKFGVEDAASGNISFRGKAYSSEALALVEQWKLANPIGVAAYQPSP